MDKLIRKLINSKINFNIIKGDIVISSYNWDNIEKKCFDLIKKKGKDNTWIRSMLLAMKTANHLNASNDVINDMASRLKAIYYLEKRIPSFKNQISKVSKDLNIKTIVPKKTTVTLCKWNLRPGSIASYNHNTGIMAIDPKVKNNEHYIDIIAKHELIHAFIGKTRGNSHTKDFNRIAKAIELPFKYRD